MEITLLLLQQLSVYLVIIYLLSKTPLFMPLIFISGRNSHRIACYVLFSSFCILGTYFSLSIENALANTRAIGAVMGGLLGGPVVGLAVGLTGGLHRYSMGGFTDVACMLSTTSEGLIGGLLHLYYLRRGQIEKIFRPMKALTITLFAEVLQMVIILIVAKPFDQAWLLVQSIALPMIIANSLGAALFMSIIQDKKAIFEKNYNAFSNKALRIAQRAVGVFRHGFDAQSCQKIAGIIHEETGVGAVSITDREKILAFIGIGDDHHVCGRMISSDYTLKAIETGEMTYADGYATAYQCSIHEGCKLGSVLVVPLLQADGQVFGTVKLYEPKQKLFSTLNRSLGEGLAKLISNQILLGRYIQQKNLLNQSEIRLLQAQVNPHFLFNTLNTISAVTRKDPKKARELIQHLSQFFRSNLKQDIEQVTIKEELAHVHAYLEIELARFADRLSVTENIADELLSLKVPTFTLQPLIENAIKHGTSTLIGKGKLEINGYLMDKDKDTLVVLEVIDNAGHYKEPSNAKGLGLQIVDKRIKNQYGQHYGLTMTCESDVYTKATILIPLPKQQDVLC
ncbi:sensor histidine kinase [Psychromonas sp. 14N.309.X.WAT.B.A12]|uniref:sensor histidine kinase n=1 Tax=Psychromonas sp. 14N.309.X.WAT.B.A12 TaxID=2998322 RepID=UPI0025AEDAFA|nr:sensor histidine kinase [Psychromonas sp. 14N.309.X.WAT.B.A12]MDN2661863.1 sensor histidine kinase [Psychromonas sp. 14N.309.X.WAT.B.A12]